MMANQVLTWRHVYRLMAVLVEAVALLTYCGTAIAGEDQESITPPPVVWAVAIEDRTVRGVISRWSHDAGWKLHWDVQIDLPIIESAEYRMPLADALAALLTEVAEQGPVLQATFYSKNNVLRVYAQPVRN